MKKSPNNEKLATRMGGRKSGIFFVDVGLLDGQGYRVIGSFEFKANLVVTDT